MDVREKLVELIANAKVMYADDYTDHTEDEYIAETILDNFITVWDGKPIEAFLHPIDAYKGLKAKYLVFKADTGEMVENCFILRPDKDAAAVEALRAYAKVTDNETLKNDIYNWVGNGVMVREWVSVDDRLPQYTDEYNVTVGVPSEFGYFETVKTIRFERIKGKEPRWVIPKNEIYNVIAWMKLPEKYQPPKGE